MSVSEVAQMFASSFFSCFFKQPLDENLKSKTKIKHAILHAVSMEFRIANWSSTGSAGLYGNVHEVLSCGLGVENRWHFAFGQ